MRPKASKGPDEELAAIAAPKYGLVTRANCLTVGLSSEAIARRLKSGVLIRVYRDVYRFAAAPASWHQTVLAPVFVSAGSSGLSAGPRVRFGN